MYEIGGKRVLITGAASGIGRGAALSFAREGCLPLLADTDGPGLASLEEELGRQGIESRSYEVDVSSLEQVSEMASAIDGEYGGVDILLNVAGVGIAGDIVDTTMEDWEWIMGVNLWGPINTIKTFLPGMIERGSGHVLNTASLGGLISHHLLGAYCTTKFGLVGLSEALYQEVGEHNIGVTAFCPGLTRTPILDHIVLRGYSREKLSRGARILMSSPLTMSVERTGDLMVRAVKGRKPLVVTTLVAKLLYLLNRLSPGLIRSLISRVRKMDRRLLGSR